MEESDGWCSVKAGQGDPRLPALEGEELDAYLRRLAEFNGREVQAEPLKPMPEGVRLPYRDGPWEDR